MTCAIPARVLAESLRSDAGNIGHGDRRIYPTGPLLDAAATIERLLKALYHYGGLDGVPAAELDRVHALEARG